MNALDKLYRAYYTKSENKLYFSELKELTGLSNSSLQNALKKLESEKQILKLKEKSNAYYILKNTKKTVFKFSEIDDERFWKLHRNVRAPILDFLENLPKEIDFMILFGSASRKKETEGSDIDLMVVIHSFEDPDLQKRYREEINQKLEYAKAKAECRSIYPLSIVAVEIDYFLNSNDHMVEQAKLTGFPIFGHQNYHEVILNVKR
ncbi:nucleotidyltransferase domain-containing protein [Methanococcus maripaludis]|uniref:protein adenylyltransferase n=1 Tax=Methanococcus maripaludis TaxID=39152 RepID=A0A7J9NTV9_METMI|nr:nucleotidyltransferase domain-containing protein [Methanococcus maripaludis]MBA2851102.1 putative nucleotidyltransferase [Methanococcus maripaludis]MBM7408509.1 putative nucleotidyltransferase [Methanococcus maripaludis]MBP2220182.1 putative nucleotidyltransferase [Methanococcus maripaludis]